MEVWYSIEVFCKGVLSHIKSLCQGVWTALKTWHFFVWATICRDDLIVLRTFRVLSGARSCLSSASARLPQCTWSFAAKMQTEVCSVACIKLPFLRHHGRRDRQDRLAWKKVFLSLGLQKMLKHLRWTFPKLLAFGLWPQMEGIGMWWYNMMVGVYVRIINLISCSDRRPCLHTLTQSKNIEVVHSYLTSKTLFASRICSIGTWLSWLEACFTSAAARGFARWSTRFANAGWAVSLQRMSSDVLECFESLWNLLLNLCRRPEHGFWYRPQQRQTTFKIVPWLYLKTIYCIRTLHDCTPPKGEQCGVFCEWHCDSIWMPVPDSSSYRPDRSGFRHMPHDPHRISSSSLLNLLHKERALRTASLSDNWLEEWVGKRRNDFESFFFHFLFCVKCDHLRHWKLSRIECSYCAREVLHFLTR